MSYNGAGVFALYTPGNPVVTGTVISSTWANNTLSDIATGLSTAITKNGQTTVTANIPMGAFKITNMGAGTVSGDAINFTQLGGSGGADLVGFLQRGTGALTRTVNDKEQDIFSIMDFIPIALHATIRAGTNTTNLQTYIQAAIDYSATLATGVRIYIPDGVYRVGATLLFAAGEKVDMVGTGRRTSVIDWRGGNALPVIKVAGTASTADIYFSSFEITNPTAATTLVGIQCGETAGGNAMQMVEFSNILFNSMATGIACYDECNEIYVDGCHFFDCTSTALLFATPGANSCSAINVTRNHFQGGTGVGKCVDAQEGSLFVAWGNVLQATGTAFQGFVLDKFDSIMITGNYWENTAAVGPFVHIGTSALGSANGSGGTVSFNHIDNNNVASSVGIKLDYCRGISVNGNFIFSTVTGILVTVNASSWSIGEQAWGTSVTTKLTINSTDKQSNITDPETRPRFHAVNTLQSDVTGDGTGYVIIYATESYDIAAGYDASTGIFTAPYPGVYRFAANNTYGGISAGMTVGQMNVLHTDAAAASIRNYVGWGGNVGAVRDASNEAMFSVSCDVPMLAGEKAKVRISMANGALATDVIAGGTFSGTRI